MTATRHEPALAAARASTKRAGMLFFNFFLIILAYYQVKSASRSLLIEHWEAAYAPYVWILSALVLVSFIGLYHRLVERYSRLRVVLGSGVTFIVLLVGFRLLLEYPGPAIAVGFYVFVDIFSVILVEQFWSLANSVTREQEGKRSYWFIGTGGLLGGLLGGVFAALLLELTPLGTADLLLSCAVLLCLVLASTLAMSRSGLYRELHRQRSPMAGDTGDWRVLLKDRYLLLIAAALLCAQLVQPVVEFQFLKTVETSYPALDERTAFISTFFGVLGAFSIGVNVAVTRLVHETLGAVAGLMIQPLMLAVFSLGFTLNSTLLGAGAMKISDRGLSYSINRASKELLYLPVKPVDTYRAKAWIDMLGYRLFKILGAALTLALTQWLPVNLGVGQLGWATLVVCAAWAGVIAVLAREYQAVTGRPAFA